MGVECRNSIFNLTFGTVRMADLSALRAGRTLSLRKIHCYSFLLEAEWNTELLNADRKIKSLQKFQGRRWEPNPGLTVLWPSASSNALLRDR
jgi:hypothetical protein